MKKPALALKRSLFRLLYSITGTAVPFRIELLRAFRVGGLPLNLLLEFLLKAPRWASNQ